MCKKTNFIYVSICFVLLSLLFLGENITFAQNEQEVSVLEKIKWQHGPSIADIDKWAEISIPEGYVFANAQDTKILMEAMGNPITNTEVGFFAPNTLKWFVIFEFDEIGYIKDDEKDSIDSDAILESIQQGTEESNKIRMEKGFPGLHIVGWEVKPYYNEKTHNLEWAIKAQSDDGEIVINHNTRLLGRRGVMKATLVVDHQLFSQIVPLYNEQLDNFSFKYGHKYAEFVKGDKVASYGLTALVAGGAGVAAAKLGLFQIVAKYAKFIVLAIAGFFATFWRKIKSFFQGTPRQG